MKIDPHYTKPHGYGAFTPIRVMLSIANVQRQGGWARPEPYRSLGERLSYAWDILCYRADPLYWEESEADKKQYQEYVTNKGLK